MNSRQQIALMMTAAILLSLTVGGLAGWVVSHSVAAPDSLSAPAPGERPRVGSGVSSGLERSVGSRDAPKGASVAAQSTHAVAGAGHITGSVVTETGAPLAGARITAVPAQTPDLMPSGLRSPDPEFDLDTWTRRATAAEAQRRARSVSVVTDADGRFRLEGLHERPYDVAGTHHGYELRPRGGRAGMGISPGQSVEFTAVSATSVVLDVRGAGGAPAESALVTIRGVWEAQERRHAWTAARNNLRVPAGTFEVRAFSDDLLTSSDVVRIAAPHTGELVVTLRLADRAAIRGRLVRCEGSDDFYGRVYLLRVAPGEVAGPAELAARGTSVTVLETSGFRFSFDPIEPGTYVVGATIGGDQIRATRAVTVTDRAVNVDIEIPEPDPATHLRVSVLAPDGTPLREARLQATRAGAMSPPAGLPAGGVRRGGAGIFWVPRDLGSGTPVARARLVATAPVLGSAELECALAQDTSVELRFAPPVTIAVAVDCGGPAPTDGSLLLEVRSAGAAAFPGAPQGMRKQPDAAGTAEFGPLQAGEFDLILWARGSGPGSWRQITTSRVRAESPLTQVQMRLPALHSLRVEVTGASGGEAVYLRRLDAPDAQFSSAKLDAAGVVVFDRLSPGRYSVTCGSPVSPTGSRTVEVPNELVVRIQAASHSDEDR